MYKSPSIEIFENVRQPRAVPTFGTGFATVGFATNGPVNKLMAFNSLADFEKYMGREPVSGYPFTHNMINRAMSANAGGTLYFMRVGDFNGPDDGKASVAVSNYTDGTSFNVSIGSKNDEERIVKMPWFIVEDATEQYNVSSPEVTISFKLNNELFEKKFPLVKAPSQKIYIGETDDVSIYAVDMNRIVRELNKEPDFSKLAVATLEQDANEMYKIVIKGKFVGSDNSIKDIKLLTNLDPEAEPAVELYNVTDDTNNIGVDASPADSAFKIVAKNPGSAMNGFTLRKKTNTKRVGAETADTFTVTTYASKAEGSLLETFSNLTLDNFAQRINDETYGSEFIEIENKTITEFKDGVYILGEGEVLSDGKVAVIVLEDTVKGTDGKPESGDGVTDTTGDIIRLFTGALRNPSFLNKDTVSFSIVATPETGLTEVQDAGIALAEKRGDAVYLVDTPLDYMALEKEGIKKSVDWSNGTIDRATPIISSYALMYYGWLQVPDAYGTSNLLVPPSVLVLPKMLSVDREYGLPCFSPAGVTRGRLIASDYEYSPDIDDRELMCGDGNSINPIIFSNTRGLMIFSQKTADRSNSAINRIHVRRMLNDIKRRLYSALDVIRFEINNDSTQSEARRIVENILSIYRNAEVLQSYFVNVTSPGGAEADVLNITVSLVPYGLIERIRIYLNIDEAGATITEG